MSAPLFTESEWNFAALDRVPGMRCILGLQENIVTGAAEACVQSIVAAPHLDSRGLHMHLGSPIFETEPYAQAVEVVEGG